MESFLTQIPAFFKFKKRPVSMINHLHFRVVSLNWKIHSLKRNDRLRVISFLRHLLKFVYTNLVAASQKITKTLPLISIFWSPWRPQNKPPQNQRFWPSSLEGFPIHYIKKWPLVGHFFYSIHPNNYYLYLIGNNYPTTNHPKIRDFYPSSLEGCVMLTQYSNSHLIMFK